MTAGLRSGRCLALLLLVSVAWRVRAVYGPLATVPQGNQAKGQEAATARSDIVDVGRNHIILLGETEATPHAEDTVHFYDWPSRRWSTMWPEGHLPPPLAELLGIAIDNADDEAQPADLDHFPHMPSMLRVPLPPGPMFNQVSVYRSESGRYRKEACFVVLGDVLPLRSQSGADSQNRSLQWLLPFEHLAFVTNVEKIAFSLAPQILHTDAELCELDIKTASWTCGRGERLETGQNLSDKEGFVLAVFGTHPPGSTSQQEFQTGDVRWTMVTPPVDDLLQRTRKVFLLGSPHESIAKAALPPAVETCSNPTSLASELRRALITLPRRKHNQPHCQSTDGPPTASAEPRSTLRLFLASILLLPLFPIAVIIACAHRARQANVTTIRSDQELELQRPPSSPLTPAVGNGSPGAPRWTVSAVVLGTGGYGTVLQGMDRITGQIVAVKRLPIARGEAVNREMALLAGLQHPNIVTYLGSFAEGECQHLVMEYVPCGSLDDLLRTYHFVTLPALRLYAFDILKGLAYLHSHGILHRDIKPANILLSQAGTCKLADFGIAKAFASPEMSIYRSLDVAQLVHTVPMGTPAYMSSEAIKGEPLKASDIWAVGLTLLELASGERPWQHVQATQPLAFIVALAQREQERYPLPEWLPTDFADCLDKCLCPTAAARASAEALLQHPWVVRDQPEQAACVPPAFADRSLLGTRQDLRAIPCVQASDATHSSDISSIASTLCSSPVLGSHVGTRSTDS